MTHAKNARLLAMTLTGGLALGGFAQIPPALSQTTPAPGVPGTAPAVPPRTAAQALRATGPAWASQIIGSRVYNDAGEAIGEVEDVSIELMRATAGATASPPMAIVQVGGFLGIGGRHVSVPLSDLRWNAEQQRIVMPGATRDTLRARPAYDYGAMRR